MKSFLISYDLRVPETSEDYKRIISYIKSFPRWAKPLLSIWFVKTEKTVTFVRDEMKQLTDKNDGILVVDVTGDNWATLGIDSEVTKWMTDNL